LFSGPFESGEYTVTERVPPGWVLTVSCAGLNNLPPTSFFEYIPGGVIITITEVDGVDCTFTNSPIAPAVGGVVIPANTLSLVSPWLAVIGLVGCIGTIVVVAKKRRS